MVDRPLSAQAVTEARSSVGGGGQVTTVTFEEKAGKTLLVMHDLYPSKAVLDEAIASGSTSGDMDETLNQLDELLAAQGAGAVVVRPSITGEPGQHRGHHVALTASAAARTAPATCRR